MARTRFRPRLRKARTQSEMTLQVAHHNGDGSGQKGSRSLRTSVKRPWQRAVESDDTPTLPVERIFVTSDVTTTPKSADYCSHETRETA